MALLMFQGHQAPGGSREGLRVNSSLWTVAKLSCSTRTVLTDCRDTPSSPSHLSFLTNPPFLSCYFRSGFCYGTVKLWSVSPSGDVWNQPDAQKRSNLGEPLGFLVTPPWLCQPQLCLHSQEISRGWADGVAGTENSPEHLCLKTLLASSNVFGNIQWIKRV